MECIKRRNRSARDFYALCAQLYRERAGVPLCVEIDHWLTDQEKQAIIQCLPLAFGHNAINPGGLGAEPSRTPSILCLFIY